MILVTQQAWVEAQITAYTRTLTEGAWRHSPATLARCRSTLEALRGLQESLAQLTEFQADQRDVFGPAEEETTS